MMASMAMVRPLSAIFLVVAVTLVSVQAGRPVKLEKLEYMDPHHFHNPHAKKPLPQTHTTRRFVTQPVNLDEPAPPPWDHDGPGTQAAGEFQQAGQYNPTRPGADYNDPTKESHLNPDEFFTSEQLAQIEAYNMAQRAKFESQQFQRPVKMTAATASNIEHPTMLSDGTETLWVDGPRKITPAEMAQIQQLMKGAQPYDDHSTALPQSQRNQVNDEFSASYMHNRYNDAFYNNP